MLEKESCNIQSIPTVVLICLHADPISPPGVGEGGGTHSYIREILSLLFQKKINHLFITRWTDPAIPSSEEISAYGRVQRICIGNVEPMHKSRLNEYHQITVSNIQEALRRHEKPILLHSIYWNSGRAAMDIANKLSIPFIHTVISNGWRRNNEGFSDHTPERIAIEKKVYNSACKVLCICTQEAEDLVIAYEVPREKIAVVGRPVSDSFLDPSRDGNGRPRRKEIYRNRSTY